MKFLFTLLLSCFTLLNAGEVQRIESIVNDISKLRNNYTKAQSSLVEMEVRLEEEKKQNEILRQDLKLYSNYMRKEKEKIVCKIPSPKIIKTTVIIKRNLNNQRLDKENEFPSLLMKEQFKTDKFDGYAYTYRVKIEANIYNAIDGEKIDVWERYTSFTSNEATVKWIKITGYFTDKLWEASSKEMWIKSCDALKRKH
ncbi:MAG: hypothetical protein COA39_009505 [Sulfurimonas sp.]|nr:hypothetical protein [Sulfurimonas sp.]